MLIPFHSIVSSRDLWNLRTKYEALTKTENGYTMTQGGIRYSCSVEQQGLVSLRTDTLCNITDTTVTIDPPCACFAFLGGEYQVYTQYSIQLAESIGQWQKLVTQIGAFSDSMRTTRGGVPFLALWNEQTQRGTAFHILADSTWQITADRLYSLNAVHTVQVRTGFCGCPAVTLAPGETLTLPRVLYYSFRNQLDMDAWKLHRWFHTYHPRPATPVVYNTWLYRFDQFTHQDIAQQIPEAADLGMEYFVVDAGWFGEKGKWYHTVGDWEENAQSAMGGHLADISRQVLSRGMKFGLWFELERGGRDSRIIQQQPELFVQGTYNKFLNFALPQVREYADNLIDEMIRRYSISYLKFDLNSDLCSIEGDPCLTKFFAGWRQFLHDLRQRHPGIYLECCASGGMRMDLQNALSFDSCWMSDSQSPYHTIRIYKDSVRRLPPQFPERWISVISQPGDPFYGEHILSPRDASWRAMMSISPSWLEGLVFGSAVGFSCDLTSFSPALKAQVKELICEVKADRDFWQQAECRILCDTEHQLVLQYSDPSFNRLELLIYTFHRQQAVAPVCPIVDTAAQYLYDSSIYTGTQLEEDGLQIPTTGCLSVNRLRLEKQSNTCSSIAEM